MNKMTDRPTGVTIIAMFMFLNIIITPLYILLFIYEPILVKITLSLVSAIIYLLLGYGLWKMRRWAWTGTIVSALIGLLLALITINLIAFIINVIVLGYMLQGRVRLAFKQ